MAKEATEKPKHPLIVIREEIEQRSGEFAAALPAHIPVERFRRVLLTAIQRNPDLVEADRRSLFNAAMLSAQDGLLPDGREGAIVIYNTKTKRDGREVWIKMAQWMPMVFGILKKIRNSGEVATITARVVYGGDKFRYWIDDAGEHVEYEPADQPDTSIVRRVFAMAKTKDGELFVEPMTPEEVEKVRQASRSKDKGPWVDWWSEMARKTAIRRLAKRLPMSTDLDDLIRRDDALYDLEGASDKAPRVSARQRMTEGLDRLAAGPAPAAIEHRPAEAMDIDTGEFREVDPVEMRDAAQERGKATESREKETSRKSAKTEPDRREDDRNDFPGDRQTIARDFADEVEQEADGDPPREQSPKDIAFDAGYRARRAGRARKAIPKFQTEAEAAAWVDGYEMADAEMGG